MTDQELYRSGMYYAKINSRGQLYDKNGRYIGTKLPDTTVVKDGEKVGNIFVSKVFYDEKGRYKGNVIKIDVIYL